MPGAESRSDHGRVALTWLGGLALLPATLAVALERHAYGRSTTPAPRMLASGGRAPFCFRSAFAYVFRRSAAWMKRWRPSGWSA